MRKYVQTDLSMKKPGDGVESSMAKLVLILMLSIAALVGDMAATTLIDFEAPDPPGPHCPLNKTRLDAVESYGADQPIVGTHFFYWYDIHSKAHFLNGDGSDALVDHPAETKDFSFESVAWWQRELQDVKAAGIDFILPVYWGCPGDYGSWSFAGLPAMVKAWERLARAGKHPPKVGLFYDTTTLRHNPRGWHVDLSTAAGKRWFYATIRDFFSWIPPKMWAAIDGRPMVVLYSPHFAAKQDPALFPFVRERFERDFSTNLYLVKSLGWEGAADSLCSWGGALGLKAYSVASLGPGYDHHAVPHRKPLVVDRENGLFYSRMWERFLSYNPTRRAKIVLVETWNELHEGTDVCETREYGRQYIELTAKYAELFRKGVVLPKTGPFAAADQIAWDAARFDEKLGVVLKNSGDGLMEPVNEAGCKCWRTKASEHGGKYVYFDLHDSFLFDEADGRLILEIEYLDRGFTSFRLEYDCNDPHASVHEGAFRAHHYTVRCGGSGAWRKATFRMRGGRFANRCNGADLRFAVLGGDLSIARIAATRAR